MPITFGDEPETTKKTKIKYLGKPDFDDKKDQIKVEGMETKQKTPRKPRASTKPVTQGDLEDIIRKVIKEEIKIDPELLQRMKKGYSKRPFGGERKNSGGWNSITYAIFEVLEDSKILFIKK